MWSQASLLHAASLEWMDVGMDEESASNFLGGMFLLRYNWHLTLYEFKVYDILVWYFFNWRMVYNTYRYQAYNIVIGYFYGLYST